MLSDDLWHYLFVFSHIHTDWFPDSRHTIHWSHSVTWPEQKNKTNKTLAINIAPLVNKFLCQ